MTELPACRWRECVPDGLLNCHSDRFIAAPNPVSAEFCRTCYYRDQESSGSSNAARRLRTLGPLGNLLPQAPRSSVPGAGGRPWTDLPPIYCITCTQTPERTTQASQHFRACGFEVQFFPGIHGKTFGLRTVLEASPGYRMPAGHIGNVLSHYMLWQTLAFLSHEEILVVEDDAWFDLDFPTLFLRAYADLPADWQFVFVGSVATLGKPVQRLTDRVGIMHYPCGTHAYLVKRSVLPLLLHTNHQARQHIDFQLIENTLPLLRCYTFLPSLVKQRSDCDARDGTGENWPTSTAAADLAPDLSPDLPA